MFSPNGANGPESDVIFGRVRQMAALGAKLLSTIAGLFCPVR